MIFSLRSKILNQNDYRKSAEEEIPKCKDELIIISAYIKNQGLLWLKKFVSKDVKVKVICRWSENDLLQGSSDLEIYEFCKESVMKGFTKRDSKLIYNAIPPINEILDGWKQIK